MLTTEMIEAVAAQANKADVEQGDIEQVDTEQVDTEQVDTEQVDTEQVKADLSKADQGKVKQVRGKQSRAKQGNTDLVTEKAKRVSVEPKDIELIDSLRGELTRTEYLHKLVIEDSERLLLDSSKSDVELGTVEQEWFTVTSKNVDVAKIRQALGIEGNKIMMSEADLLTKASELSGYSVADIQKQARQTLGQKLITQFSINHDGKQGQAGSADSRLDAAYEEVKAMIANDIYKGKLTLTAVASRSMTNFNTAKSWAIRRGHPELIPSSTKQ